MVSKVFRSFLIFSLSIILLECSFDTKTGIWVDKQKRKAANTTLIKLSDEQNKFEKELNPGLTININSKAKTNKKWIMSGLNYLNLISHLKLSGRIEKFSKYKFNKIPHSAVKENPLIIEENYFITVGEKGSIVKFVDGKKVQWNRNIYSKKEKKKIESISLALSKNKLYVIDNLGKYYAIDVDSGKIIWIKRHDALFNSQIKVYKGKIYAIDSNNMINCFSTTDGKRIWKFETPPTFIKTNKKISIIVTPSSVLFSNTAGDIAKVSINDGELNWFMPTQNTLIQHETNFLETSDIVLFKRNIFFSNNFSKLYSLNLDSGMLNWILNINSNLRPILIDNLLFTISQEGYLIVIDSIEGKIIRSNYILDKFKAKQRKKLFMQGFLIASDKVYITTNLGYLIICSVNTGKVEKVSKLSKSELSEPIISNNHLYILTNKSLFVSN
jgi:outer membrane protein assembly factor BamB